MSKSEIKQIRIGNNPVGIVGLDVVLADMAVEYAQSPDDEIGEEMLKRLEAANYIPRGARDLYRRALVREFRKFLGRPWKDEFPEGLRVVVLGPGCAQCDRMETEVREVMTEMNLAAALDHVTDVREIGRYGVLGVPALIINDRPVCVGQAPNRNKIRDWLQEALASLQNDRPIRDVSHET